MCILDYFPAEAMAENEEWYDEEMVQSKSKVLGQCCGWQQCSQGCSDEKTKEIGRACSNKFTSAFDKAACGEAHEVHDSSAAHEVDEVHRLRR